MGACPVCGVEASNAQEEVDHMNAKHPEVVSKRLRDAGFVQQPDGSWLDTLADPNS